MIGCIDPGVTVGRQGGNSAVLLAGNRRIARMNQSGVNRLALQGRHRSGLRAAAVGWRGLSVVCGAVLRVARGGVGRFWVFVARSVCFAKLDPSNPFVGKPARISRKTTKVSAQRASWSQAYCCRSKMQPSAPAGSGGRPRNAIRDR